MKHNAKGRDNRRIAATIGVLIAIAVTVVLLMYINQRASYYEIPRWLSSYSFLAGNYTTNSTMCSHSGTTQICDQVLTATNTASFLPRAVALQIYTFASDQNASTYISNIENGTTVTPANGNNTFVRSVVIPFINGQTVFTSYVQRGRTVYAASALFNRGQPTNASAVIPYLAYKLAYS